MDSPRCDLLEWIYEEHCGGCLDVLTDILLSVDSYILHLFNDILVLKERMCHLCLCESGLQIFFFSKLIQRKTEDICRLTV